jgi:prepilin-type N-terminal cleavage/methylation domain-containing protein
MRQVLVRLAALEIRLVTGCRFTYEYSRRAGYTLLEVIVVLILLAVAAAVVAPGLLSNRPEPASEVRTLVDNARQASVRRGEMVRLTIDRSGLWRATVGTGSERELLMAGRLDAPPGAAADLIFSPLGTCGIAAGSDQGPLTAYDPLTCEERPS